MTQHYWIGMLYTFVSYC